MELNLKIEQYEGPLDLLLALITKHKIDIFDITIADICELYTSYQDAMRCLEMVYAGECMSLRESAADPELFKKIEERYYSVEEKTVALISKLEQLRVCRFDTLFERVASRGEAVAVFLALLELVRDGVIDVERNGDDIELSLGANADTYERTEHDEY